MRHLLVLSVLVSTSVLAADFRACTELFVSPLYGFTHSLNRDGTPRDVSRMVVELRARPLQGKKPREVVIGPKLAHTDSPAWNSALLDKTSQGAWMPLKVGDLIRIRLIDEEDTSGLPKIEYTVKVPEEAVMKGVSFVITEAEGGSNLLFLRFSATDGRRACKGVKTVGPLVYEFHRPLLSKVDPELFARIAQHNHCAEKSSSAACDPANYTAAYGDDDENGLVDIAVSGGPFDGGTAEIRAFTVGFEPQKRQVVFVGGCEKMKHIDATRSTCRLGDTLTVISLKSGEAGTRPATEQEQVLDLREDALKATQKEVQQNLRAAFQAERGFLAEHDKYSDNATEMGFDPPRGNRYTYFLAARGTVQKRDVQTLAQQPTIHIIGPDTLQHPKVVMPAGLKEAGCPLTQGTDAQGKPMGLGLSGRAPEQHFILYAIGNVDEDADPDCWSISDVERKDNNGNTVYAGTPFHERED